MNIAAILICLIQLSACQSDSDHYTEIITEVFSVVMEDDQFKQGPMKFSESYIYDSKGVEFQHIIYNNDKSIQGVEKPIYESSNALPSGSNFTDARDSLLSYYKYTFDDQDRLYKKIGFDAANNEMLRIELYHYDKMGNKIAKEIRAANDKIQSVHNYSYDPYGNEKTVTILDSENQPIFKETYDNISLDKDKKWNQRWGYNASGEPTSFSVRRKRVLKKSK